jgi:hypothetical protein
LKISALYIDKNGPYANENFIYFCKEKDARKFKGPNKVIAHPPCDRWGRYWGGGPMLHGTNKQKILGDDDGCFAHALWSVRSFGGVIEHPEASHAFKFFGLPIPKFSGGWTEPDNYGGRSCCVAQGNYGHRAQKMTWLYGVDIDFKELRWGRCVGKSRLDAGFHSRQERSNAKTTNIKNRLTPKENNFTPLEFQKLLVSLIKSVKIDKDLNLK